MSRAVRRIGAVAAAAVLFASCGGADAEGMTIEQPRIGATPVGADAALYFDITSRDDDHLLGVESDVARLTSLHRTDGDNGAMLAVDDFELPAGTPVRFEPFGDHVMLEAVERELRPGDQVDLVLRFERHEPVDITADVSQLYDLAWEDS